MCNVSEKPNCTPLVFLKFSKEKWILESMQKGNLYLNTLKYFVDLEKKEAKGIADNYEAGLYLNSMNFIGKNISDGTEVFRATGECTIYNNADLRKHILCMTGLYLNNFSITEKQDGTLNAKINFTDKEKEKIIDKLGKYVLVAYAKDLKENITSNFKKDNIYYACGNAIYDDYSVNGLTRILDYTNDNNEKFFYKDNLFKYQKEYRFTVLNQDSYKPFIKTINDMSKYASILETKDLFNNFELEIKPN